MKRVAVVGNAGGGKSTLSRRLAEYSGLPLYPLDIVQRPTGAKELSSEEFLTAHAAILIEDRWIIDGYGSEATLWPRLDAADTVVYLDLPVFTHYLWVTKRFVKGLFSTPEGWPENSPMWRSTLSGYRVIRLCDRHLTPRYREFAKEAAAEKRVFHLKSAGQIHAFLRDIKAEFAPT